MKVSQLSLGYQYYIDY